MYRKIASLFLALLLVASLLVAPVKAEATATEAAAPDTCACGCNAAVADIQWRVWDPNNSYTSNGHYYLAGNYIQEEQFGISARTQRDLPIEGVLFFTPLKGAISQGYDQHLHPSVDITAPAGSVVKAVLDGTVISADWNNDTGYTMYIQHVGDIISVYKHNERLLKAAGDKVTAGSPVAIIGNTGELTTGTHLHFELWHKGNTVDPTKYINF